MKVTILGRKISIYFCSAGVGGHGGAGTHADLEDRYKEIIQRVSQYAVPELKETVPLSPRDPPPVADMFLSGQTMNLSSDTPEGVYNQPMVIPGYAGQEYNGPLPGGATSHQSTPREQPDGQGQVPQSHVAKCAVCIIL